MKTIFFVLAAFFFIGVASAHPMLSEAAMDFISGDYFITPEDVRLWLEENPEHNLDDTEEMLLELLPVRNEKYIEATGTEEELKAFLESQNPPFARNVLRFLWMGIIHILEGPDHVLFVLALLLVPLAWGKLLKVITTFTVAHSITLILAGKNILTLSSAIVEPVIALSIAYVALTSVFLKNNAFFGGHRNNVTVVFLFGLFHGLGFAGVFKDIGIPIGNYFSSLLSFNVGVEMGQIVIICIAVPVFTVLRKYEHQEFIFKMCAVSMSVIA